MFVKAYRNNKIENLQRQEATPAQKDLAKKIIPFGENDNFPLRLARLVQNSPTASSCISTKSDFIEGGGFSDQQLADKKVNSHGERFGDIHADNSKAYALFEGFALLVRYNLNAEITEISNIPFEYCRLGIPDDSGNISKIYVNPYFGTGEYNIRYTDCYDVYNPSKNVVLAQQAKEGPKYKGQILYFAQTSPLSRFYPAPDYYSCSNWMSVDEGIGGFHNENLQNNFLQSAIIRMIGDPNQPSSHPDDMKWDTATNQYIPDPTKTVGMRFNDEMQKFTGWENTGNIMALWGGNKEEMPDIQAFPTNNSSDIFKVLQDVTTEQICRATKTPSVLANIQSGASLGGDGNLIRASVKLMQQRVLKIQATFCRVYVELFSHFPAGTMPTEVKILNYNPFPEMEKIDPQLWQSLTPDEKRDWIKSNTEISLRPPQNKSTATTADENTLKAQADLRGSVGGVQGVLQIQQGVVDKTTTIESALSILTIIYGFTDSEARRLLGQPDINPQQQQNNKIQNVSYSNYPQAAKEKAKKALEFRNLSGQKCGGKAGWATTQDIIDGKPISFKQIRRIKNFLSKNKSFESAVFSESCQSLLYAAWGGTPMLDWCENIIGMINE